MNSLEFIATQYDPMDRGETITDFRKFYRKLLWRMFAGHTFDLIMIDLVDLQSFQLKR